MGPLTHMGCVRVAAQCMRERDSPLREAWLLSESEQVKEDVHMSEVAQPREHCEVRRMSGRGDAILALNRGTDQTMLVY